MSDEIQVFLDKVDAFAQGLTQTEQAMLATLIADEPDNDVSGYNLFEPWPAKIADIAPLRINLLRTDFGPSSPTPGHAPGVISGGASKGQI